MDYKTLKETDKKIGITKIIIMLGAGIMLLLFEFGGSNSSGNSNVGQNSGDCIGCGDSTTGSFVSGYATQDNADNEFINSMENKIRDMLLCMDSIEEANVFITLKSGSRKVVLTETPYNKSDTTESDKNGGSRVTSNEDKSYNTVYVTDENGNEIPYVVSVNTPEILGIAVAVKGSIGITEKDNIIKMINTLTGIGINNISIINTN